MNPIIDFINSNRDRYVDELKTFLAIPSISALPEYRGDVRRCSEWTAEELRRIGLQNVRLIETPGYPVVYGDWLGATGRADHSLLAGTTTCSRSIHSTSGSRRRLRRRSREGEIYARGAADDKGQIFMHFKAGRGNHEADGPRLPVNIKFVLEGEEEVGSAHLDEFVRDHKAQARGGRGRHL